MPVFTSTLSVVHHVSRRVRMVGTRLVQTAVVVGACLAMPRAAAAASGLASGSTLPSGQVLTSGNGHYTFANQVDGNLVLYVDGYPLWASETSRPGALVLEANGDLVLSDGAGVVWSSGTSMYAGATLAVQDDGNVVL